MRNANPRKNFSVSICKARINPYFCTPNQKERESGPAGAASRFTEKAKPGIAFAHRELSPWQAMLVARLFAGKCKKKRKNIFLCCLQDQKSFLPLQPQSERKVLASKAKGSWQKRRKKFWPIKKECRTLAAPTKGNKQKSSRLF